MVRRARVRAPAKVNLNLRIVGRRPDGYHLLDSEMVPIDLFDDVRIGVSPADASTVNLVCRPPVGGIDAENLATRAAEMFLRRTGRVSRVEIAIRKEIPVGAGLGGGSSNAAAVLKTLNAITGAGISELRLMEWGLELGADIPFFVLGRPARAQGVGERLEPLCSWPSSPLVVAFPGAGLSTVEVYRAYDDSLTSAGSASKENTLISGESPHRPRAQNDLETAAFQLRPELKRLRERLLALGARGASMTGSGSALFGFWESWGDARRAAEELRNDGVWARAIGVLDRVPEPVLG
jgi:4-diphosphocytidyl-2-C-methyl-D-erythritol kinase